MSISEGQYQEMYVDAEAPRSSALTLYEIHDELQAWSDSLELAETPEERAEIEARISRWLNAGRDKVDGFNAYLSHLESQAELAKKEVERIKAIRSRIERVQADLEGYAIRTMETLGVRKLEGNTSSLSLRLKPSSVIVDNPAAIPHEFLEVTINCPHSTYAEFKHLIPSDTSVGFSIRKHEIAKAIKSGQDVPGATLAIGGNSLVRK